MEQLLDASAATIAAAIRNRQISAADVMRGYLARIEAINPQLNAIVQVAADRALDAAESADDALARGEQIGPLHGVPMTIKDSFDTAGVVSSWGSVGRSNYVPSEDATIVARLRAAGAILVGKTNTPEFTYAFETDNRVYGYTRNPYNLERSPGGSSGGAAAAVAAAMVPFDIGTDTGGSIRVPSHMCGIAGIKPTSGRVPRTGHAVPPGSLVDPLTQIGPMARFVEDLGLILPIISGPDGRDPFVYPVPLGDYRRVQLRGLRAAFFTDNGIMTPSADIIATVEAAADALALAGVHIVEARPPGIEETLTILSLLYRGWDGAAMVKMLLASAGTDPSQSMLKRYLEGGSLPGDQVAELIDRWDQFRLRLLAWMNDFDLIITPSAAFTALRQGEFLEKYAGFSYTMTYNLTGWPGAVVRCGTAADGLPIGVQAVARPWREDVAIAAIHYLETVFGGWQRPPVLDEAFPVGSRQ